MTEIERLIKQAELLKKRWKPLKIELRTSDKTWQELLDGGDYPHLRYGKL